MWQGTDFSECGLQFLVREFQRILAPCDDDINNEEEEKEEEEDGLGRARAAGARMAQAAHALNALVRLDYLDVATFVSVSAYLRYA